MIYIKEESSIKITGITSLFLSFHYNEEVINIIKSFQAREIEIKLPNGKTAKKVIGNYYYNKDTNIWELPLNALSYLVDRLTYVDDIKLELKEDAKKNNSNKPVLKYKTTPYEYQLEGIEYGLNHDSWLLLDAPGLGKTLQLIYLAEELKEQRGLEHCLIVCGVASLRTNWKKEIEKHSNLSCRILGEKISKTGRSSYDTIDKRVQELVDGVKEFFIITNIESFRDKKIQRLLTKGPNKGKYKDIIICPMLDAVNDVNSHINMVVLDEAHAIKNNSSQQAKNFIRVDSEYKIAATGTLLLNNLLEAYVPLSWIGVEHSTLSQFESNYCVYGGFGGKQLVGYKNVDMLKDILSQCSLRRTKDILKDSLPSKTVITEYVEMKDDQYDFYRNVVNGIKEECDKVELNATNTLALTTRLRQASVDPSILTTSPISAIKLERCVDLVDQLVEQGEKVVIMSTFKEPLNSLNQMLNKYEPLVCNGDTREDLINKNKEMFQEDDKHKVMLCTWQKMGTGHTLNRASYMIFLDTPFTFGVFDQACDRIHRIGSKNPVFIYNLVAANTIDEQVLSLLNRKRALGNFVIDDVIVENDLEILKRYIKNL